LFYGLELIELNLEDNALVKLPVSISSLKGNLTSLSLCRNRLDSMQAGVI
jgi:hypothetical protein